MNIIKLKDTILPGDEYYNIHLKGKYAYWIHMKYIVSFDDMNYQGYVACEENIAKLLKDEHGEYPAPYGCPYYDMYKSFGDECQIHLYVDFEETDRVNSIKRYLVENQYTTDPDITIGEVKLFRTWLAKTLLSFDDNEEGKQMNQLYDEIQTHMLEYYANNMYDDTLKYVISFNNPKSIVHQPSTCGCCKNASSDLSSLYTNELNVCDGVNIYKKGIYTKMIETFSNVDFWKDKPLDFLQEFKQYINNIITLNLPLRYSGLQNAFVDCNCNTDSEINQYMVILKNLSLSLEYIIDKKIDQHKLFIFNSLNLWATNLYEYMLW